MPELCDDAVFELCNKEIAPKEYDIDLVEKYSKNISNAQLATLWSMQLGKYKLHKICK